MPEGGLRVLPDLMCWSTWLLDKPWKNVNYSDMDLILLSIATHIYIKIHCMLFDVKYKIGRELSCFFQVSVRPGMGKIRMLLFQRGELRSSKYQTWA